MVRPRQEFLGPITVLDADGSGTVDATGAELVNLTVVLNSLASQPTTGAGTGAFWVEDGAPTIPRFTASDGTTVTLGSTGTDTNAIHDNTSGEIVLIPEKLSPADDDLLIIEDSADGYSKRRLAIGSLPGGIDTNAIHDNVSGEIVLITQKVTPANSDFLVIEDSADGYSKKRLAVGDLPGGGGGGETLEQTLALGNTTGSNWILVDDNYGIDSSAAGGDIRILAGGGSTGNMLVSCGSNPAGNGGTLTLESGSSSSGGNGGVLYINSGVSSDIGLGGSGGAIWIQGGAGDLNGGSINLSAGAGTDGSGGSVVMQGGSGNGGGQAYIRGGDGVLIGGQAYIGAGSGSAGDGGEVYITAGTGSVTGGRVTVVAGDGLTGGSVTISAGLGNDGHYSDVVVRGYNINFETIGTGTEFKFNDGYFAALGEREIRLYGSDNHYAGLKAPATGINNTWTLPDDDGPDGYVLTTDGSKNLYWSAGGGGGTTNVFNTGMVMLAGIATNSIESWQTIGAVHYVPEEYSGTTTALLRALINTGDTDGYAKLRVWNLTHDEIGGAEMTSNSTSFDPVSAVIPLNAEEAVYALQLCVDGECEATAANAWVQLGSSPVSVELTTMPESIYAGVETTFGITVSNVPWVLIIDGYARATGTGTGSEQNVSVTIPTGDGYRYAPVLLSVGAVEDTGTIKAQEILELGSLCVAMVPGLNPTQSYSGHGGDLYVWVGTYFVGAPGEVVTGITYGGNALTKVSAEGSSSGNDVWMHCYRLAAENMPAPGAQDIVVSCVSGAMTAISLAVAETSGTISTPDDVQHGSSACPNDTNVSVTTAVDNSVVIGAIICSDNATYTPLSGQTIIAEVDPGMYAGMAIGWYQAGTAGSTAANWTPIGYIGSAVITTAIAIRPS